MAVVTTAEIATALGLPDPGQGSPQAQQWAMWIGDAEMLIEARLGDLADLDETRLRYVVREAVSAQARRPDDATTVQVAVDDGSMQRTYSSSRGRVFIRDEWWDLLAPTEASGAFSVDTALDSSALVHADTCSLRFGGQYCSCGAVLTGLLPLYGGPW